MVRKKLELTYIPDDTVRGATFSRRVQVLIKKLDELKLRCGVNACAIIFNESNSIPEALPSHPEVKEVLEKLAMLTESEQTRKSVTHEEFLKHEIAKVRKKSQLLAEANKEGYMTELMFGCLSGNMKNLSLSVNDRPDLCSFIDQYIEKLVHHRNHTLNTPNFEIGGSSSTVMAESGNHVDVPISNSAQVTNDSQLVISSDQRLAHGTSVASSNQEVYIPVMNQDEFHYMDQNQNEQQGFVEEMLKLGEQTGFPWMEDKDNHQF